MIEMKYNQIPCKVVLNEFHMAMEEARRIEGDYTGYGEANQGEESRAFEALMKRIEGKTITKADMLEIDEAAMLMCGEESIMAYRYGLRDAFRFAVASLLWGKESEACNRPGVDQAVMEAISRYTVKANA